MRVRVTAADDLDQDALPQAGIPWRPYQVVEEHLSSRGILHCPTKGTTEDLIYVELPLSQVPLPG